MTIRITTLDNGLHVVTDAVGHVETVSVGLWFGAGARQEPPAVNGAAHLIEHMLFKGTTRRSAQDIAEEIEAVGGHINAYTTRETTAFYAKVLKEDLALAVDILSDMAVAPAFDPDELRRERSVVLQEIGQAEDTPDDIIFDHMQAVAFPDQPIGRPVLGSVETVNALDRDALLGFKSEHYGADRLVVSGAGKVDHDRLVELASAALASVGSGSPCDVVEARYEGGETRFNQDLEQVHLLFGFRGLSVHDDDLAAQAVFSTALGGGMSSRLFQEVREKRGLVYSIYSMTSSYDDSGVFRIYAGTGGDQLGELVPIVCDQLAALAHDVADAEIDRAKAQLRAQLLMGLESIDARCEQHALHLLRYDRVLTESELLARIDAVDREAIGRVSARLLGRPPTLAAIGPIDGLESYESIEKRLAA